MSFVTTLAESLLVLRVDDSKVDPELEKATQKFKARMDAVSKIAEGVRNAAVVGMAAGLLMINNVADAAKEKEAQLSRFRATIEGLGDAQAAQIPKAEQWAAALQKIADFDDDDLLEQLGKASDVTKDINEGMLLVSDAADLARKKNIDLASATELVIMAWNGQQRGLKKLVGDLGEGVKGHAALIEIQKRVAGGAASTADTVERSEERMKLAWEAEREKLGKDLQPTLIKVYGLLGDVAKGLEGVNGNAILVATGIAGTVAAAGQGVIWYGNLRTALNTLATAQKAATTATNAGNLALSAGVPSAVAIAVAALAAMILKIEELDARFDAVTRKIDDRVKNLNANANTGVIQVGFDANGNPVYSNLADMGNPQQGGRYGAGAYTNYFGYGTAAAGPLGGFAALGALMHDAATAKNRAEQADLAREYQFQQAQQQRAYRSPKGDIDQQLANIY